MRNGGNTMRRKRKTNDSEEKGFWIEMKKKKKSFEKEIKTSTTRKLLSQ